MVDELSNDNLFTEKATTEQYRLSKFKQRYHYDPTAKNIVVNGETYKVDLDNYKSGTMQVKDSKGNQVTTIRQTAADLQNSDPVIHFDENFFKLKNPKRMDAILQHEIGHTKMHSLDTDSPHMDKSMISPTAFNEMLKEHTGHQRNSIISFSR